MHDPFRLATDITCPHCGVKGRLVAEQETRYYDDCEDDFELLTCVECGGLHESHGSSGDEHLKAMRIQYGRLIEKRPYEPPKPAEPEFREPAKPFDATVFENILKQYYSLQCLHPGRNAVVNVTSGSSATMKLEGRAKPFTDGKEHGGGG